ncbi:MAG: DUF4276 family protein [Gemmatimonadetes bacterium]|nr:DUF4276 family protein [Gemmatimonadota bacterium]
MHFEVLVEDQSGKKALDILIPKIIGDQHTFRVIEYRGVGRIPRNLKSGTEANKRILLDRLPSLLRGYGKTFADYPPNYPAVVILVCDLDDKCLKIFRQELFSVLNACNPKPETRFCIAIEEGEAWLLGDIPAIKAAYPKAKDNVLSRYKNDDICGTWELLADAVSQDGANGLRKKGWAAVGHEKSIWAERIAPHMDVAINASPSFCYFHKKIRELI